MAGFGAESALDCEKQGQQRLLLLGVVSGLIVSNVLL